MTLVVAPAGAGKSLGVAGWVRERAAREGGGQAARWVHADGTWTPARLERLLDEAAGSPADSQASPRRLVIDDAHLLPTASHRALGARLDGDPDSMSVLLLSRWDLPIAHLVPELLGNFALIRGDVLRLDDEEARSLIVAHARTAAPDVVEPIARYANGWCAAVVLAARAVAGTPDPAAATRRCTEGKSRLSDRVASEAFASLPTRIRHLLLCLSAESVVTPELAEHLANDATAGEILAELESTGLLVSRLVAHTPAGETPAEEPEAARYRLHPLLTEVVRRRLVTDSVDVVAARSTVVRAVRLDAVSGHTDMALGRLLAVRAVEEAAAFVVEHGVAMVMRGEGSALAAFVSDHAPDLEHSPALWFPFALERWVAGDAGGALTWLDQCLETGGLRAEEEACARLMRARLAHESMHRAAAVARDVLQAERSSDVSMELLPQLLTELAITQNWLGDLHEAEANLAQAASLARYRELPALEAAALSHLALTHYMLGHERGAIETARHGLAVLEDHPRWAPRFTGTRLNLAVSLARSVDVPWEPARPLARPQSHPADLCARFWLRIQETYAALAVGDLAEAQRLLQVPLDLPGDLTLPDHLSVVWLAERAAVAAMARDRATLREIERELVGGRFRGEASWVAALRADLDGDRRGAIRLFGTAAADATVAQPVIRPAALVAQAQLLDELGDSERAHDQLWQAAVETEVRRNATPFLGWTRQGTPIQLMLARLVRRGEREWVQELAAGMARAASMPSHFDPGVAVDGEPADDAAAHLPVLSARETEVLHELARGSTYADISADLSVSENTVKTHVGNLYAKLGATRRSEALAVARTHHLL